MNILYFDCMSGVSVDMVVGAFLDLGIEQNLLMRELEKLNLCSQYKITISRILERGIYATDFQVQPFCGQDHDRTFPDIYDLIDQSRLNMQVKNLSKRIFLRIAKAESRVQNQPIDRVTLYEAGTVASIISVVAAAICVDFLKPDIMVSSPLTDGTGFVRERQGFLSMPITAALEIVKECGAPMNFACESAELLTPMGAAIVCELCENFDILPAMTVRQIGFGAGKKDLKTRANVLRLIWGKRETVYYESSVCIIETNIDSFTGDSCGYIMERSRKAGKKERLPMNFKQNVKFLPEVCNWEKIVL